MSIFDLQLFLTLKIKKNISTFLIYTRNQRYFDIKDKIRYDEILNLQRECGIKNDWKTLHDGWT